METAPRCVSTPLEAMYALAIMAISLAQTIELAMISMSVLSIMDYAQPHALTLLEAISAHVAVDISLMQMAQHAMISMSA